jgi:ATP synthase, F0 subunit b
MQSLDIISINIWHIVISLCNLLILYLMLKKFLYKPVKKVLAERQAAIDSRYDEADRALSEAHAAQTEWNGKMAAADEEAAGIVSSAVESANRQSSAILGETKERAERMISRARAEADAERRKAEDDIKAQIADVSVILAEKILDREINAKDHSDLINSFISEIGDDHEGDE